MDDGDQFALTDSVSELETFARRVKVMALTTAYRTGVGHCAGDLSSADILTHLNFAVLNVPRSGPGYADRDRLIVSKSHASASLYSILALRGWLDEAELDTYGQPASRLCTAVSNHVPGVEFSTGALGHGLPFAVGAALAARHVGSRRYVHVVTGDGELQEGSNWEAIMFAGSQRLEQLILTVDRNHVQKGAQVEETNDIEPLSDKFTAFNWEVVHADGHDQSSLLSAYQHCQQIIGRPKCVIAETIKGHGVSFMVGDYSWHANPLNEKEYRMAVNEIMEVQ